MSESEDAKPTDAATDAAQPPKPPAAAPARLRRGLFGYRRKDVDAAILVREGELAELRREIDMLWLGFSEHERTLRGSDNPIGAAVATAGLGATIPAPPAPPGPQAPTQRPATGATVRAFAAPVGGSDPSFGAGARAERRRALVSDLADLESAMRAIEEATRALERTGAEGDGERNANRVAS